MTEKTTRKPYTMLALLAVFIVPVVLAKLALDNNWFNRGVTNKGELIQPVMDLSSLLDKQPPKWRLVYQVPAHCDAGCENALYSIQQVWLALGRDTDRAQPTVLFSTDSDIQAVARLQKDTQINVVAVSPSEQQSEALSADAVYLVDTLNNAMLRYTVSDDRKRAIMNSRDMLADVRKLLKLSRIG